MSLLYLLFIVSLQVALFFNWQTFSDVLMSKKQELTIYAKYPLLDICVYDAFIKKNEKLCWKTILYFVTSNSIKEVC
jgi:hypothetical protein